MAKGYYHVSSQGLEKNDIFKSRKDFIQGVNDIAICALGYDVCIVAFCLMSNHFHFVLYGTKEECWKFAQEYKRRCAIRMRIFAGEVKGLQDVGLQIDAIDSHEYLENAIAYVLRNPMAAGIFVMPFQYPWSSLSAYFTDADSPKDRSVADMSVRCRRRLFRSRFVVPDNYLVDDSGMILPSCFVDTSKVEEIFRHPARLMMAISRKVENDVEVRLGLAENVSITDQDLQTQMNELIRLEFGCASMYQLSMKEKMKLCTLLKRNFGAGIKQIARVTRLSPDVVGKIV